MVPLHIKRFTVVSFASDGFRLTMCQTQLVSSGNAPKLQAGM